MNRSVFANIYLIASLIVISSLGDISLSANTDTSVEVKSYIAFKEHSNSNMHSDKEPEIINNPSNITIKNSPTKKFYTFPLLANTPSINNKRELEYSSKFETTAILQEQHPKEELSFLQCNTELERIKQIANELHTKLDDMKTVLKKLTAKKNERIIKNHADTFARKIEKNKENGIMKNLYREIYQFIISNEPTNALFATNLGLQLEPTNLRLLTIKFQLESANTGDLKSIKTFIRNFGYF